MTPVAIVGFGTMGPGMAAVMARAGLEVRVHDIDRAVLARAPAEVGAADAVLGRLGTPRQGPPRGIACHGDLADAVRGAALVLESVVERVEVKQQVLRKLEGLVAADCLLASNTSGIPIGRLQDGLSRPERVVGMHWSNPPHIIPLIEVIGGPATSAATVDRMVGLVGRLGLRPVVVRKDVPGFVENRILYAIMREALDLVERGVIEPEALDTCVSWGIGFKLSVIGPMALLDTAGLDIYQAVATYLNRDLAVRADVSPQVTERTSAGRLGLKSGGGIYDYAPAEVQELRRRRAARLVAVRKALEAP